jgi:DNA segregation ATPase FtsK/SpoIIIE-like protein
VKFPFKLTTGIAIVVSTCFLFIGSVSYLAASETIATVAPIAVWVMFTVGLVIAAAIGLDKIQWYLLRRAEYRRDQSLAESAGRQAKIVADRDQMKLMFEGRLMAATVRQAEREKIHPDQLGGVTMSAFPRHIINQIEAQAPPQTRAPLPLPDRVDLSQLVRSQPSLDRLVLGISEGNQVITESLNNLTHIAIAGVTRFGKSIFTQMLLYQIATAKEKTSLYLADLGGTTFIDFGLPYASSIEETEAMVIEVMAEAQRRKGLYEATGQGIRSLDIYNQVTGDALPWVVMIIDEALYLMERSKAVKENLELTVSWAAKYGITAMIVSQDFKANVISTATRNNFSSRFQFMAEDPTQANILIKGCNAHQIEIKGRCFARLPGENRVTEIQTPYISEGEIRAIASHIQGKANVPEPVQIDLEPQPARADIIRQLHADGLSNQAIAEYFGKTSCSGRFYYEVKDALAGN